MSFCKKVQNICETGDNASIDKIRVQKRLIWAENNMKVDLLKVLLFLMVPTVGTKKLVIKRGDCNKSVRRKQGGYVQILLNV